MKGKLIFKYSVADIIRSKWLTTYTLIIASIGFVLLYLDNDFGKLMLSLSSIVFYLTPLITILYTIIYFYGSQNFIELLLTMPVKRKSIIRGIYFGIAISLSIGLLIGLNLPILINFSRIESIYSLFLLNFSGVALTFIFTGVSLWIALRNDNKLKGFGYAILIWVALSVIYDSILLSIIIIFRQYPLEKIILAIGVLNPVDLARVMFTLNFESSAILGHTGATFRNFFGTSAGIIVSALVVCIWVAVPYWFMIRKFRNKDF